MPDNKPSSSPHDRLNKLGKLFKGEESAEDILKLIVLSRSYSLEDTFEELCKSAVPVIILGGKRYTWQDNVLRNSVQKIDGTIEIRDPSNPDRVYKVFNNAVTGSPQIQTPSGWEVDVESENIMVGIYAKAPFTK